MPYDAHDDGYDHNRNARGNNSRGGRPQERRGIPLSDLNQITTDASRKVIGCAIEVHRRMGPGYEAELYLKALKHELKAQEVKFISDHRIPVKYKDVLLGDVCAELFIEDRFLVRITARPGQVGTYERLELRSQLKAADLDLGLIINFSERRLKDGLVRVLNIDKLKQTLPYAEDDLNDGHISDFDAGR